MEIQKYILCRWIRKNLKYKILCSGISVRRIKALFVTHLMLCCFCVDESTLHFPRKIKAKRRLAEQRFSPQERQAYWVSSFGAKLVLHLFVARFFSRSFVSGKSQHGISASTGNDVVTYQQCLHLKHSLQLLAFAPEKKQALVQSAFFYLF